ncbi:MAG: hypothetical protein KIS67_15325 [Verrucomicrobiae bacterium]|nr:hypothetical protein [Verrucomicrobiae bacterium]
MSAAMANADSKSLIAVLQETKQLLGSSDNDFVWSSWDNAEQAVAEIQQHIEKLESGDHSGLADLKLLFAPTGSIQEAGESSGWGKKFLAVADKFDREIGRLKS